MNLTTESLVVIIGIGVTAGWLGYLVRGTGFGLLGDMAIGIVGALVGDLVLPLTELDAGIGALIVNAALGAVALLLLVMFAAGGTGLAKRLTVGRLELAEALARTLVATVPAEIP